ncbi:hypothetical protein BN997_00536 [Oceanobacillus oncorhynchi]|uniref:DUF4435 domain-containing protein n=1 Tax=Oceanobacillus oncorhynchi TaxID=545501 RepID=A0A0A1MM23_9BACI|nr:hypothetical protein BN997_00536 [Oceanobacillus oncorhynchi]
MLERILENEFKISEGDQEFTEVMEIFNLRQSEFHDSIALLNAWIFTCKKHIESTGENIKLRLNELSFRKHLIEVSLDQIICKYNLNDIKDLLNIETTISDEELDNNYIWFKESPHRGMIFRGKFELEFFKIFLMKIIEDRNKKDDRKIFQSKSKVSLNVETNILTTLSIYAETPEDLYDYIEKIWNCEKSIVSSA